MTAARKRRPLDAILADIEEAGEAALELVARGRGAWREDRLLRMAGEAIVGRVADAAGRLPEEVRSSIPDVPWEDIRDIRILVDHVYHRIDHEALWATLERDVPHLLEELSRWKGRKGESPAGS
ncbi:MAG: DUF86 domain-containing protein [Actinobacteria bacterium]|nr:DUF86 domain-containing protein [Actinomycetota bacterium]